MTTATEIKTAIANESNLLDTSLFITGFELEFHKCNGKIYTGRVTYENDYEVAIAHLKQLQLTPDAAKCRLLLAHWETLGSDAGISYGLRILNQNKAESATGLVKLMEKLDVSKPEILEAKEKVEKALAIVLDAFKTADSAHFTTATCDKYLDMSQFQREAPGSSIVKLPKELTSTISLKQDSSVEGGEIVIAEPLPVRDALGVAEALFRDNEFKIDTGCSFHIHLSVPGLTHRYGAAHQWEVMLYLLSQYDRVPKAVRTRWKKDTNYYRTQISTEKYSFVHFHNKYKTWEFRCFGNVDNLSDATTCYELALEAMQHAYRVQLGMSASLTKSPFSGSNQGGLSEAIREELSAGRFRLAHINALIERGEAA